MKSRVLALLAFTGLSLFSLQGSLAQEQKKEQKKITIGTIESFDPRFDKLFAKDAAIEQLGDGFTWTEGPVWMKNGGLFLFSEIPNNRVMKWKEGEGISEFLKPSGYTGSAPRGGKAGDEPGSNGLLLDNEGRLLLCEHGDRRVTRIEKDGKTKTVLADKYMGKRFNSPNDLTIAANGDIYFTDPIYGLPEREKDKSREMDYCGVYRISAKDKSVSLVVKDVSRPNGVVLSPDDKTLYVANSEAENPVWMAYAVKADGSVESGKVFADAKKWKITGPGVPDGMKCDKDGNIFSGGPGGIVVLASDGTLLGRLRTDDNTANCAFGGPDGSMLYIAINHRVGRIPTLTKGRGW